VTSESQARRWLVDGIRVSKANTQLDATMKRWKALGMLSLAFGIDLIDGKQYHRLTDWVLSDRFFDKKVSNGDRR